MFKEVDMRTEELEKIYYDQEKKILAELYRQYCMFGATRIYNQFPGLPYNRNFIKQYAMGNRKIKKEDLFKIGKALGI